MSILSNDMDEMDGYQTVLQEMTSVGLSYVVIGTFGLQLLFPQWEGYPLKDCDLVIPNQVATLEATYHFLRLRGWTLTLWGEPIRQPMDWSQWAGKMYFRAEKKSMILDMTFDCPIPWKELNRVSIVQNGIKIAGSQHILELKAIRGTPRDLSFIRAFLEKFGPESEA